MSLGQIFLTALLYTLIGMGTVFCVLIFISICIWLLGKAFAPKKPAVQAAASRQSRPLQQRRSLKNLRGSGLKSLPPSWQRSTSN